MSKSKSVKAAVAALVASPIAAVVTKSNLVQVAGLRAGQRGVASGAPAMPVSTRRHGAIVTVALSGAKYRVSAPHCTAWFASISAACAAGPASVSLLQTQALVPGHFIAYVLNKGYLVANPA